MFAGKQDCKVPSGHLTLPSYAARAGVRAQNCRPITKLEAYGVKKLLTLLSAFFLAPQAYAWDSPAQAVSEFLKFELNGGRLTGERWREYTSKYIAAPAGYDEPGWDEATVVRSAKVGSLSCVSEARCSAHVTFVLYPTKDLRSPSVVPHKKGGNMVKQYTTVRSEGSWLLEPSFGSPIVSIEAYTKHSAKHGL